MEERNLFAELVEIRQQVDQIRARLERVNRKIDGLLLVQESISNRLDQILSLLSPPRAASLVLTLGTPISQ
jgi:hypothetical protein